MSRSMIEDEPSWKPRLDQLRREIEQYFPKTDQSNSMPQTVPLYKELDRKLDELLVWAHKVSEKTGIPLENL